MSLNLVMVPGPFVRASSWEPTAQCLRESGYIVQVPDVLADQLQPPAWSDWTSHLLRHVINEPAPVLIGHSSAGPLVAELAGKVSCRCIIIVDGHVPPSRGPASPVRPTLRSFIEEIKTCGGMLPIWSKWFADYPERRAVIGLDRLASDPLAFAEFEHELRRFPVRWIDDTIELSDWDHVPAGYIQTSELYDYATDEARRRGWPVTTLRGTHLHPVLEPEETAIAIIGMINRLTDG